MLYIFFIFENFVVSIDISALIVKEVLKFKV